MKKAELVIFSLLLLFAGCSSSKTSESNNVKNNKNDKENSSQKFEENFDLTPYHAKIDIPEAKETSDLSKYNLWYSYPKPDTSAIDSSKLVTTSTRGYRVVVLSTDDLQSANELKSELYNKINEKNIYLDFEPPFYKVKVGDFTDLQEANNLKFKLNQLGYKDARVISESVNVTKQQQ